MIKIKKIFLITVLFSLASESLILFGKTEQSILTCITKTQDLSKLFATSAQQIKQQESYILKQVDQVLGDILRVAPAQQNFENIMRPLDDLTLQAQVLISSWGVLQYLSPNDQLRTQAQNSANILNNYLRDKISLNQKLYQKIATYLELAQQDAALLPAERYFVQDTLRSFKRNGLDLPAEKLNQVKAILANLDQLKQNYLKNISDDVSAISVDKSQLIGVPAVFLDTLNPDKDGLVKIICNDHSYLQVIANCQNASVREKIYRTYVSRAYPKNQQILKEIVSERARLAQLLGQANYAELDLCDQMVQSPARAQQFLLDLLPAVQKKAACEVANLIKDLPSSVVLDQGKIQPWDMLFIKEHYKKEQLDLNEQELSAYFEQKVTVSAILKIYEQFFNLRFEYKKVTGLWVDQKELEVLVVYQAGSKKIIGYLILDLFARANKLPHAGVQINVIPAVIKNACPAVSVILTNFAPQRAGLPALLNMQQVRTFFHEFGHAMHAILGRTALASQSGINVKMDFVEMPSQMLEHWLDEPVILQKISKHYQTGQSLSQELIDKMIAAKNFDAGDLLLRQINYSLLALDIYGTSSEPDFTALRLKNFKKIFDYLVYDPNNQQLANFMHIVVDEYGPKYYGYLWSRVFASDIFAQIKAQGLDNPIIGQRYVEQVLSKGGSCDPNLLLASFLGRQPNQVAFIKNLGL